MGKPSGSAAIFALSFRRAIDTYEKRTGDGPMSLRRLGKLTDPDDPERGRRRAQRHHSGTHAPSAMSRRVYAHVLSAPELLPEEDEEESLAQVLLAMIPTASVAKLRRMKDAV